jgi:protein Mpv17
MICSSQMRFWIVLYVIIGSCLDVSAFLHPTRRSAGPPRILPRNRRTISSSALHTVNALAIIDQVFQSSPYATAAITCGIKASSADWIAQKRQYRLRRPKGSGTTRNTTSIVGSAEPMSTVPSTPPTAVINRKAGKTDMQRNIAFLLYGALYQGIAQEFIYNHLYPLYFGTGADVRVVLVKVAFDLLVQTTIVTLPIAYLTKAIIYKYSFREAMQRYIDDVRNHGLLIKYFSLWGPVQCITFSIIPEHYRIAFIAFVSFFWLIILSTISSRIPKIKPKVEADSCDLVDGMTCNIDG